MLSNTEFVCVVFGVATTEFGSPWAKPVEGNFIECAHFIPKDEHFRSQKKNQNFGEIDGFL